MANEKVLSKIMTTIARSFICPPLYRRPANHAPSKNATASERKGDFTVISRS